MTNTEDLHPSIINEVSIEEEIGFQDQKGTPKKMNIKHEMVLFSNDKRQNKNENIPSIIKLDSANRIDSRNLYSPDDKNMKSTKNKLSQNSPEKFFKKDNSKIIKSPNQTIYNNGNTGSPDTAGTSNSGNNTSSSHGVFSFRRNHYKKPNENPESTTNKNNVKEKKALDDNLYSYSPYNYQSLLYIPDEYLRKTATSIARNDLPFKTFNELSRSYYNPDSNRLKQLLKEQEKTRNEKQKKMMISSNNNNILDKKDMQAIDLIKKQLDYNKNQEILYMNEIHHYLKELCQPIQEKLKQDHEKLLKMPKIKVLPSRNLNGKSTYFSDTKEEASLILPSTNDTPIGAIAINSNNNIEPKKTFEAETQKVIKKRKLNVVYRLFWMEPLGVSKWRPDVRESATFTAVGRYVILYAGISNTILEDICIFDPNKQTWNKPTYRGDIPLFGRHGHSACEYKKTLIIFGGERRYNQAMRLRECLNDLRIFNPETNEWKLTKSLGKVIDPRRNHAAVVHENSMFVYGGINTYGQYLKDVWGLNFKNYSWTEIVVENAHKDTAVAFHTMNGVYIDRGNPILKDKKRVYSDNLYNNIYPEGFYIFGGKDQKDRPLNTVKILKYESKIYSWEFPEISGKFPIPRYKHVSIFYEPLGILLIHGGRNDSLHSSDKYCLSDIHILNLEYMQWAKVTAQGYDSVVPRCSHSATLYNSNLLIFGGFNGVELCGSVVRNIDLSNIFPWIIYQGEAEQALLSANSKIQMIKNLPIKGYY